MVVEIVKVVVMDVGEVMVEGGCVYGGDGVGGDGDGDDGNVDII